jgi:tetratricopeptide (TPR) repeat protein
MKRKARSPSSRKSRASTVKARAKRLPWLLLGTVFLAGGVCAGGFFLWYGRDGSPAPNDSTVSASAPPPGKPPIDAAVALHLSAELPQTAEELNEELLVVGRQLVESLPNEAEAHSQMAFAYAEVGQHDKAIESWECALAQDETYSPAQLAIAVLEAERGQNDEAVTALRRVIVLDPESEEAYQLLAEVLLRVGKAEESREAAQECVRRFPENYENHFWLGQAYLDLGAPAEARRCHEEAIRLNPDWTQSYYSLAVACARLGDAESAKRYREQFAKLKSIDQDTDRDQTRAYDDRSSRRRAVVKGHILAGALQLRFAHADRTEAHWLRAAAMDRSNTATREALVLLYQQQGRAGAALQVLDELIQLESDEAEYLLQQGRLLFGLQRWQDAERTLKRVLELTPDSAEANMRLAQIHLRNGTDMAAALSYAEKAAKLAPSADSLRLLGAIRTQNGDYDGARAALKQALAVAPYDPELRHAYEQLLQME